MSFGKYLGFMFISSLTGLLYFRYTELVKKNVLAEDIISRNQLSAYLLNLNEQSAYSIDQTMKQFQKSYNISHITNYRKTLVSQAEGKVLEVCAGSNRNLRYYKPGTDLTLIDYSPNMVGIGTTKLSPIVQYKYLIADVTKMPFNDNEFDTVIDTFGLEYVEKPYEALAEIRRVCKPKGKILLLNEGLSSILEFHYWENAKWGVKLINGGYFGNRNWQKIIREMNFNVLHAQRKKNGKLYIFMLQNNKEKELNLNIDKDILKSNQTRESQKMKPNEKII